MIVFAQRTGHTGLASSFHLFSCSGAQTWPACVLWFRGAKPESGLPGKGQNAARVWRIAGGEGAAPVHPVATWGEGARQLPWEATFFSWSPA